MRKVVYNACHGGFALSKLAAVWLAGAGLEEAVVWLAEESPEESGWSRHFYPHTLARHSQLLIECIESLGPAAAGTAYSDLRMTDVHDVYRIEEYDGLETVVQPDEYNWISAVSDAEILPMRPT